MPRFEDSASQDETISRLLVRVSSWFGHPPSREDIEKLRWDLDLLEYQLQPKPGWSPREAPQVRSPVCAAPGCKAGWKQGLVNQAGPWNDPVWYCQEHEPAYRANGVSAPPASPIPAGPMLQKAREMSKRWPAFLAKLEAKPLPASPTAQSPGEGSIEKEPIL